MNLTICCYLNFIYTSEGSFRNIMSKCSLVFDILFQNWQIFFDHLIYRPVSDYLLLENFKIIVMYFQNIEKLFVINFNKGDTQRHSAD